LLCLIDGFGECLIGCFKIGCGECSIGFFKIALEVWIREGCLDVGGSPAWLECWRRFLDGWPPWMVWIRGIPFFSYSRPVKRDNLCRQRIRLSAMLSRWL